MTPKKTDIRKAPDKGKAPDSKAPAKPGKVAKKTAEQSPSVSVKAPKAGEVVKLVPPEADATLLEKVAPAVRTGEVPPAPEPGVPGELKEGEEELDKVPEIWGEPLPGEEWMHEPEEKLLTDAEIELALEQAQVGIDDPVRMYLHEIGKVGLLTAQKEKNLASRIEKGRYLEYLEKERFPGLNEPPSAMEITNFLLKGIVEATPLGLALMKELNLPGDTDFVDVITASAEEEETRARARAKKDPIQTLHRKIGGEIDPELVNRLAVAISKPPEEIERDIVRLSVQLRLMPPAIITYFRERQQAGRPQPPVVEKPVSVVKPELRPVPPGARKPDKKPVAVVKKSGAGKKPAPVKVSPPPVKPAKAVTVKPAASKPSVAKPAAEQKPKTATAKPPVAKAAKPPPGSAAAKKETAKPKPAPPPAARKPVPPKKPEPKKAPVKARPAVTVTGKPAIPVKPKGKKS